MKKKLTNTEKEERDKRVRIGQSGFLPSDLTTEFQDLLKLLREHKDRSLNDNDVTPRLVNDILSRYEKRRFGIYKLVGVSTRKRNGKLSRNYHVELAENEG